MTQFDYRRTKKPNWKPLTHLLRLEPGFSFTRGGERGAMLSGGIILAQQTSTSIEGRAIKSKILNPRDVKHLTQSTRNWVCALTQRHDINLYILLQWQLQSVWKEAPTGWVAYETVSRSTKICSFISKAFIHPYMNGVHILGYAVHMEIWFRLCVMWPNKTWRNERITG